MSNAFRFPGAEFTATRSRTRSGERRQAVFGHVGRVRPAAGARRQQLQRPQPRDAPRRPRPGARSPAPPRAPSSPRVAQRGAPPAAAPAAAAAAPVADQHRDAVPETERGPASPSAAEHVVLIHPRTRVVSHGPFVGPLPIPSKSNN